MFGVRHLLRREVTKMTETCIHARYSHMMILSVRILEPDTLASISQVPSSIDVPVEVYSDSAGRKSLRTARDL